MAGRDDDGGVGAVSGGADSAAVVGADLRAAHPLEVGSGRERPLRFGVQLLGVAAVPTAALFVVPQQVFASFGLLAVLLVVIGGAAAAGTAAAAVLRTASSRPVTLPVRGANAYFLASGLCFVALCMVAPAAALIATFAWYDFRGLDARGLLMTAVAAGGLLLGAVFAVSGAVLLRMPGVDDRLSWAKVDLTAQVFALASVLATTAVLY